MAPEASGVACEGATRLIDRVAAERGALYDAAGGMPAFERLVGEFYDRVESSEVLRPLYPRSLAEPRRHLTLFLAQYFGGPDTYSRERGHPRLRARHLAFAIGRRERDAWLACMDEALAAAGIGEPSRSEMQRYFEDAATFMINQDEIAIGGPGSMPEGPGQG
jgi:hemoglobin